MRKLFFSWFIFLILIFPGYASNHHSPIEIKVGGYIFEPFLTEGEKGDWKGITLDLIEVFNSIQKDYYFRFVHTSSLRRFEDLKSGQFDLMFFENKKWGWEGLPVKNSKVFLRGGEVYVTMHPSDGKRNQKYFNSFSGKRIVGVTGFHYGFTSFKPLTQKPLIDYELLFVQSGIACLGMVIKGRADIAVVSRALVNKFIAQNPEYKNRFLISEKMDQEYQHSVLVKEHAMIGVDRINALLDLAERSGQLEMVWKKHHIFDSL